MRRRLEMSGPYMRALIGAAALVVIAVADPAIDAQKPERQKEFKIPGLDVTLRPGWQLLVHDHCRCALPESWRVNADGTLAIAPDASHVSIRTYKITNWSVHKAQIRSAIGRAPVVREDSERRLWFEIGEKPRVQHYIDVPNGLSVCSVLLEIDTATPDAEKTVRRIADSIGPAPDNWPPTLK